MVPCAEPVSLRVASSAVTETAPTDAAATYSPVLRERPTSGSVSTEITAPANGSPVTPRTTPAANPTGEDGRRNTYRPPTRTPSRQDGLDGQDGQDGGQEGLGGQDGPQDGKAVDDSMRSPTMRPTATSTSRVVAAMS